MDNDGYASYPKVIAVGASSDKGRRSLYSDTGNALWCVFPSSDGSPAAPLTPGIWTTDVTGSPGYSTSAYTDDFGGTSSACPGAAGIAALVLARNPDLRWDEVKDIFKRACDRIDAAGGAYDAVGTPALAGLNGQIPTGTWALTVADRASRDTGNILSFTVELDL